TLVLGKHSGRHAIQKRCEELGFALSKLEVDRVYRQVVPLADRQKHISDAELIACIERVKESESASARPVAATGVPALVSANGGNGAAAAPPPVEVGYGHGV